jgi:hypothetical protein
MSLAFKGRGCELYNESVVEPSDAVGAGKVKTSALSKNWLTSAEKKGAEGCFFWLPRD